MTKEKMFSRGDKVLNAAMKVALDAENPDQAIQTLLAELGKQLASDRIYIFEDDEQRDENNNTYEWCAEGVTPEIDHLQHISRKDLAWWYEHLEQDHRIVILDVETMRDSDQVIYGILKPQGIHSLLVCPLILKDRIIGYYGVDNPPVENIREITKFIDMLGSFLVSLIKLRDAFRELESLSQRDKMTGLYNRGTGERLVRERLEQSSGMFLILDGDGFKRINDTYGHIVGDTVIVKIADVLSEVFGEQGIVLRLGGDEYAAFVPEITDEEGAAGLMERLKQGISGIRAEGMQGEPVCASVGVAFQTRAGEIPFETLYKQADDALYEGKEAPGTRIIYYKR